MCIVNVMCEVSASYNVGATGTRRRKVLVPHDSTALLNQLRMEEKEREKEQRRQQMVEKQKEKEAYLAELQEWEDSLYPTPWRKHMNAMWEVLNCHHWSVSLNLQTYLAYANHMTSCYRCPR